MKDKKDHTDDIHMIQEPLLTEEGFVNEAGVNELNSFIKNMPPAYERLANDLEWTEECLTTENDILGAFAKSSIRQSPYPLPEGLESVLEYVAAHLRYYVDQRTDKMKCIHDYMFKISLCEINKLLHKWLTPDDEEKCFPPFLAWNRSKVTRPEDADHGDSPDYDFIDLHALLRNVCLDIRMERRSFKAFSDKFNADFNKQYEAKED